MLPALRCGQNAFAENIFFSYSAAVQTIFESIRQMCRKIFKVITRIFIVELLPYLYLKMSAMPVTSMSSKKKNNQCLAESAVSVTCLQIARLGFLIMDGEINLHRPQISSDPQIHCFGHRYPWEH